MKSALTAEEQDKDKLGKRFSERNACRQKWPATLCLSGRRMCITWCQCSRNWDRELYLNDFAFTNNDNTGVQVAVNTRKGT